MTNESMRKCLWWLCLFVAPLVLLAIELFHPEGFTQNPGAYQYLSHSEPYNSAFSALAYPGPHWWFWLHMIQTPMVALVCVGLWLMVGRVDSSAGTATVAVAWLARLAIFVFFIYYTALDAIGGFGLARTILITKSQHLPPDQLRSVIGVIDATWTDPWVGGVGSFVSETGSCAAFAAAVLTAGALRLGAKVSWPPLLILVAFGWELQDSHAMPHGPVAFALLVVAAVWIWVAFRAPTASGRPIAAPPRSPVAHGTRPGP